MKYRFFAFLIPILFLLSCEQRCDCNFTIITAIEQCVLDNNSAITVSNDTRSMAENTIELYHNHFPEKYLHRSLDELCTLDTYGKQNAEKNTPCRLSYFVGRAENKFKIYKNGSGRDKILIHKSKKPMDVGGQKFNLYSLEIPATLKDRNIQFICTIVGQEFLSKQYQIKGGQLYL